MVNDRSIEIDQQCIEKPCSSSCPCGATQLRGHHPGAVWYRDTASRSASLVSGDLKDVRTSRLASFVAKLDVTCDDA